MPVFIQSIHATSLAIPFTHPFKHARAERGATQSLWVQVTSRDGLVGFGEGCPRNDVTGEDGPSAQAFVSAHFDDWLKNIRDRETLADWVACHETEIDANPAAWTAVELALLDLLGKNENRSVESLLGIEELSGSFQYTAVLGDGSTRQFEAQLGKYLDAGFRSFKIKLSGTCIRDIEKVRLLAAAGVKPCAVRADANNLWADADAAIWYLNGLGFAFFALEEPLKRGDYAGMRRIAQALHTRIILDQSLLRADQLGQICDSAERWIVNLRVSKMGGLLRSLQLVDEVRTQGLPLIVGAHVGETSLLTRAALTVASGAQDVLLAQEGAAGTHLLAYDVIDRPIMFGAGGRLAVESLPRSGSGGFQLDVHDMQEFSDATPSRRRAGAGRA
jgi:L-Ala-D/L-Glu epimerase